MMLRWLLGALACGLAGAALAQAEPQTAVSSSAQAIYGQSRDKLVQIRTLRRQSNTQSSVGSGFVVQADGLIVTNYHVAAQAALDPPKHRLVAVANDNSESEVQLIAIDVQHDLALLRPKTPSNHPSAALSFRPASDALKRGERIYSLGNPLDVGFAITEGNYNGEVLRSFYPRIFFGGTLNAGMSGGPALDARGRVIGINVAKRLDGEQVSFLIPAAFASALIARAANAQPITEPIDAQATEQLFAHQSALVARATQKAWGHEQHGPYSVPVPPPELARCWGSGRERESSQKFDYERSECRFESSVFDGKGDIGGIKTRYEAYDGSRMHRLQFAQLYSDSFGNEYFSRRDGKTKTDMRCAERTVSREAGLQLRAVVCLNAYRKLKGLHDLSVWVATVDEPQRGIHARLDAKGLSMDGALRLTEHYLSGFKKGAP